MWNLVGSVVKGVSYDLVVKSWEVIEKRCSK